MRSGRLLRWLIVWALMALPGVAHAQEATLIGNVSDTTGGALPGVTVRAVHEATGNNFEAVTDERGDYRLALRVGAYKLTAELAGFSPAARTLTLLVGQEAVVNLQMSLSGVQESVTVTGEAPLLDVTESSMGGNIDPRQLQELPVQGRNWVDLVTMAPGARGNSLQSDNPSQSGASGGGGTKYGGDFQLNVDGQQVSHNLFSGMGQPRFSKDAIAEFELVSSRFDATQGRSSGIQVNAVTKSGTNTPSGTFAGYFRDDRFNAQDPVVLRVLPYQNQQLSATFGGPIRKDRAHFFANFEYEREPNTAVWTTPYPQFNIQFEDVRTEKKGGGRVDLQFSPQNRLSIRGSAYRFFDAMTGSGGATSAPPSQGNSRQLNQVLTTLTQVLSGTTVNEVKGGYVYYERDTPILIRNPTARFGFNGPIVLLRAFRVGGNTFFPQYNSTKVYSIRDDFTSSFTKGGRHTLKAGVEYLKQDMSDRRCNLCEGELSATNGAIPANITSLFPDVFDATTWNLAPLSSISLRWRQVFAAKLDDYASTIPRHSSGLWAQDDWAISPRFTLNLGMRYDLEMNAFANDTSIPPFLPGGQPNDRNNASPRVGFSFRANDLTVVRGGYGTYFGTVPNAHYAKLAKQTLFVAVNNDGRADFASNPWNGPEPSFASLVANLCTTANRPGCQRPEILNTSGGFIYGPDFVMPFSHQASIGIQRQVGVVMAFEADYVYAGHRNDPREVILNLSYDPATGVNYPFNDIARRPFPEWGFVSMSLNGYRSNSHALQTSFTKRFSNRWQASGNYTLSSIKDADPRPHSGLQEVPFATPPDLGGQYSLGIGDQRHRAVLNGIWELPYAFQLSGLYFFGSGERYATNWGVDLRNVGTVTFGEHRLRPDGTIVPRNDFVGSAVHRVDFRVQRRFPIVGRAGIDVMVEVFNVFNHANFGSYTTQEVSVSYGRPSRNEAVAYAPRMMQLGFRLSF